jgi:Mif2/CENP-C like
MKDVMVKYEALKPKEFVNREDGTKFSVYNDAFSSFKSMDASFGLLVLGKNAIKPNLNSGEFQLRFFVHAGVVKVCIHKVSFVAHTGCEFLIPQGILSLVVFV